MGLAKYAESKARVYNVKKVALLKLSKNVISTLLDHIHGHKVPRNNISKTNKLIKKKIFFIFISKSDYFFYFQKKKI